MGSYLGPDGYFHSASIPFPNTTVDFTFPATTDSDNNNYYFSSRHNSNNSDNLPSFPDTFGPTTTTTTTTTPHISHPDFPLQIPYAGYCPGFDPQYQYREYTETQTLGHPAQFQQPSLPSLPHLPLPSPNFGGGNTHPFCRGGFDQFESPSGLTSSNQNQIPPPHLVPNQGYHHSHPLSSSSAFFPAQEFDNPSTSPVQDQNQVVQQCAGAPHRPQDSVDPPSNSPSRSFDTSIDIGSSSNDIYHLHQRSHNQQPPTISGTFLPPTQQQQPPPPPPPSLSLTTQNNNFDSISSANIPSALNTASGQEPGSDDYYVSALVSANFSSPSLPPLNSSPFTAARPQTQLTDLSSFPQPDFGSEMPGAAASSTGLGPRRSRRLSQVVDLTKEENRDIALSSSPVPMGPPAATTTRKRRRSSAANASASNRRTSVSNSQRPVRRSRGSARHTSPDGSVFGESSPAPQAKEEDLEVLDLSKADEVPKELQKPAIDNRVKLSKFQCVICMDDVSNLTVTHCG